MDFRGIVLASSQVLAAEPAAKAEHSTGYHDNGFGESDNNRIGITTVNAVLFLFIPDFFIYTNYFNLATNFLVPLYCIILTRTCLNFVIIMSRHKAWPRSKDSVLKELRQEIFKVLLGRQYVKSTASTSVAVSMPMSPRFHQRAK